MFFTASAPQERKEFLRIECVKVPRTQGGGGAVEIRNEAHTAVGLLGRALQPAVEAATVKEVKPERLFLIHGARCVPMSRQKDRSKGENRLLLDLENGGVGSLGKKKR